MQKLSVRELTKMFSGVRAVDCVSADFHAGEIHAVLGENGAGKSTLMHILSGLYRPDVGEIYLNGQPQVFSSARDALAAGIAMVHQHFMLVPSLTVAENILLALPGYVYEIVRRKKLIQQVSSLAEQYGISLEDPGALVSSLPVGARQRIEILKALVTNARILILDEPTAVLTPDQVASLFASLKKLKQDGYLILLITHKIPEVLAISDRLSVLRRGRLVTTRETRSCSITELASLMVEDFDASPFTTPSENVPVAATQVSTASLLLTLQDISVTATHGGQALQNLSLTLYSGEIVGIAGVDGNGQTEFTKLLIGLLTPSAGTFQLKGQYVTTSSPARLRQAGVALIPQDRRQEGLALNLSIAENLLLNAPLLSRVTPGVMLPPKAVHRFAEDIISRFAIRPANSRLPVATLSGGNQQRVVIARELSSAPQVIIAANPSRGLDIGATRYIHQQLREHQRNGAGIILISTDLDEILSLSNRVYTLYRGQLLGPVAPSTSREQLSQMMNGIWKNPQ